MRDVANAHRRGLTRGHADHALAQTDFAAHARSGVTHAGHGVQLARGAIQHQHHGVRNPQVFAQAGQQGLQQFVQSGAARQTQAAQAHRAQQVGAWGCGGQQLAGQRLDLLHRVDVRALERKHLRQALVRGNARQLRAHALEQRALGFGAQIAQLQAVVLCRHRVEQQHRGAGVGQDVLTRLVEELERQRHMALVHVHHLREIGHVGRAVGRTGGDVGRDGALQAGADGAQRGRGRSAGGIRRAAHGLAPTPTGRPARGPGV